MQGSSVPGIDWMQVQAAVAALHDAPAMAYIVCSGAGAGLTQLLWSVAGCSRTLIGSEFPYDARAFANVIGRDLFQHTSPEAAIALATAAYLKGQQFLVEGGRLGTPLIGLGLTAAVSTDRQRRGEDKVFVAVRSRAGVAMVAAIFERGHLSRNQEGEICDLLGLNCLLWASGLEQVPLPRAHLLSDELTDAGELRPSAVRLTLDGAQLPLLFDEDGRALELSQLSPETHVIFPGSFNPMHFGHDLIARAVAGITGKQVVFEIAAANADKPEVDRSLLAARALQFRGRWAVLVAERLPLFIDKARVYGGHGFIIGLDTAVRLFDPKYFGGEQGRDASADEFRALGTRFYVCNRGDDPDAFRSLIEDPALGDLFVPVPLVVPVSSSELRAAASVSPSRTP